MNAPQKQSIRIADNGRVQTLDYDDLLQYHKGNAVWGLSAAFRALQLGANIFSQENIWDRRELFIISSHPGPGVRDAIEYVTRCISRNKFELADATDKHRRCSGNMQYKWQITCGGHTREIALRDEFVPTEFYELLDRLSTEKQKPEDKKRFDTVKNTLVEKIWNQPIASSFSIHNCLVNKITKKHAHI